MNTDISKMKEKLAKQADIGETMVLSLPLLYCFTHIAALYRAIYLTGLLFLITIVVAIATIIMTIALCITSHRINKLEKELRIEPNEE